MMDIRRISYQDIDDKKWDACIMNSINGKLYAYSWYLNLVCDTWDALVDGDYEQVFPLPFRERAGIRYIFMPPFTQQLGLFSRQHITPDKVNAFIQAIPKEFKLVDLNLNTLNKVDEGYPAISNRNFELDLIRSYEQLRSGFSENIRRNIRKGEDAGMELIENVAPAELIRLFRENRGRELRTYGDTDYALLERLIHALLHRGMASISAATVSENKLLAAAVIAELPHQSVFLFSATERRDNNHGALAWLIDSYIRKNSPGQRVLDFEGSNDPGLARFYAGFGATETTYPGIRLNRLPWHLRIILDTYRYLRDRLPRFGR